MLLSTYPPDPLVMHSQLYILYSTTMDSDYENCVSWSVQTQESVRIWKNPDQELNSETIENKIMSPLNFME
jgi:hypothetical protein